jgi:hypothetical protein
MFYVDIEDASSNKLGTGPIKSAVSWHVSRPMDGAGVWSFVAPLADVKMAQATPRRYAHIYAYVAGSYQWVGGGPIDAIKTDVGDDGTVMAEVSGDDMMRELVWRSVGNLSISDDGGQTYHDIAVEDVMAFAPAGWTATPDPSPGWDGIYGQFGGETVLAALSMVAERSRSHFYLSGRRALTFASSFADSGVRCVAASHALGTGQAAITALSLAKSSYDLVSRIIPIGSGQARAALTLSASNRVADAGYTLSTSSNYIINDAVEATYGRCERVVAFKDIAPLSNTDGDIISAANTLYDAARYWLDQHSAPVNTYSITIAECPALVRPLQTVHVTWREPAQQTDIDGDLYVLGVEWEGDDSGVRTAGLVVSDVALWPESDTGAIVENIAQGQIYQAIPQLNANGYVVSYTKTLDDVTEANFRFRFDDDVTMLVRAVFDFQVLPLESTVKTIAFEQETGGTITTSFTGNSGASGSADTGGPSVSATGAAAGNTSGATGNTGASTGNTSGATGNTGAASGNTGAAAGSTGTPSTSNTGDATGGDVNGSGQHGHGLDVGTVSSPPYDNLVYFIADGDNSKLYARNISSLNQVSGRVYTITANGNHTHSLSSHSHTLNSHTHDLGSHVHGLGSHAHDLGSHVHGLGSHAHDLGSHTHTLNSHTHTIAHTHTIDHTHVFTPSVDMAYGVFRDDPENTFGLTDLEYSVDTSTWYAFSVGVNGFTILGSGWYRIDLTDLLQNTVTLRPLFSSNTLQIRRKSTGAIKKATIDAQLAVRTIIQATALV